jgi:regulator of sigma E protease
MILTIVAFIIILSVLVLAHEFGHFITAKMSGIIVEEFGLGYPPRIFGFKRGETIYSLNAIPFGGFTKMLGEEDPQFPGSFASKSRWTRFLVLIAGSLMNILLPIVLFTISAIIPHNMVMEKVLITNVAPGSPAQTAGIETGDILLKINGRDMDNRGLVGYNIQLNLGKPTDMLVQKPDGSEQDVTVVPRWKPPEGEGATGIMIDGKDSTVETVSTPFWEAIPNSFVHCWEIMILFRNEIVGWFVRGTAPQLSGPIGIAQLTGEFVKAGISPLIEFAALISISLGIFNLFPFPGLDGGRILFVFLEWVRRGKRISPRHEGLVHTIGFIILIMLILFVSYFDVMRLIQGVSIIP